MSELSYLSVVRVLNGWSVLLTKYRAGDKTRRLRWVGHAACMWEGRGVYRVLVGET
jgi:hypothetical protein